MPEDQLATVDKLLRQLDESLNAFPFSVEGLDLSGNSGFKPLPVDAEIFTDTVHNGLWRITRFYSLEFHWTPVATTWSRLDQAWQPLFEALAKLNEHPRATLDFVPVEKYDIDPASYDNLLKSDRQ